jgi:8-oxo-dGTP pyrophosphatase MutT (NUDIX family)
VSNQQHRITRIGRVEVRLAPGRHPIEEDYGAEIEAYWQHRIQEKPEMFDGPFFLTTSKDIGIDAFTGIYQQTNFSAFLYWRSRPDLWEQYSHVFSIGLITCSDNRVIFGRMAPHTASAGKIYPPAGSIGPEDIVGGLVDFHGNIKREVAEETGLSLSDEMAEDHWTAVELPGLTALLKRFYHPYTSSEIIERINQSLPELDERELDGIFAFGPGEVHAEMSDIFRVFQLHGSS